MAVYLLVGRLEQAAEPENLAQETIINNLAPQEATRLARVRNIGIAVRVSCVISIVSADKHRHILIVAKLRLRNECSSTQGG